MIRVQVADKDLLLAQELAERIKQLNSKIVITSITDDFDGTLNSYQKDAPDVLILGVNTKDSKSKFQRFLFTEEERFVNKRNIIICTDDYSSDLVFSKRVYKVVRRNSLNVYTLNFAINEIYELDQTKPNFHRGLVYHVAMKLGFDCNYRGTRYLIDVICEMYESKRDINDFHTSFKIVGEKNGTTSEKIKSNIVASINLLSDKLNQDRAVYYFPEYDGRKLSTKYCITLGLQHLRYRYPNDTPPRRFI